MRNQDLSSPTQPEAATAPNVWTRTRWAGISNEERHLIHHSLRMLAKYLSDFDSDKHAATKLADEIWSLHSADVEQR